MKALRFRQLQEADHKAGEHATASPLPLARLVRRTAPAPRIDPLIERPERVGRVVAGKIDRMAAANAPVAGASFASRARNAEFVLDEANIGQRSRRRGVVGLETLHQFILLDDRCRKTINHADQALSTRVRSVAAPPHPPSPAPHRRGTEPRAATGLRRQNIAARGFGERVLVEGLKRRQRSGASGSIPRSNSRGQQREQQRNLQRRR